MLRCFLIMNGQCRRSVFSIGLKEEQPDMAAQKLPIWRKYIKKTMFGQH